MNASRGFIVLGISSFLILGLFLVFVTAGWPGDADSCINSDGDKPNTCYCEGFNIADVREGKSGVRQPVNTWSNLYALITAGIVAVRVYFDRKGSGLGSSNLMKSNSCMPDLYIFCVLFLGLGSMWFHASLKKWGGIMDGMSMYVYASFLVFYTVRRLWNNVIFFWIMYPLTVFFITLIHSLVDGISVFLIGILVVAYLVFEIIICVKSGKFLQGKALTIVLWWLAAGSMITATIFWALSQTDAPLCDPNSAFQPHGLLWHPLAGVMAVLLYFYWREEIN